MGRYIEWTYPSVNTHCPSLESDLEDIARHESNWTAASLPMPSPEGSSSQSEPRTSATKTSAKVPEALSPDKLPDVRLEQSPTPLPDDLLEAASGEQTTTPSILQLSMTRKAPPVNRFVGRDVNSILKRPITHALVCCTKDVLNVVLDSDAVLRNFENKGVQKYQKFAGTIIQHADESFEAIIYASHTFRRLNLYGSITAIPSPDDRQALGELMEKIEQEFSAASSGFLRVSIGMDSKPKLFLDVNHFLPKDAPVPDDLGSVHACRRIIEYVKADMTFMYGKDSLPPIFETLKILITNAAGISADCTMISTWLDELRVCISLLKDNFTRPSGLGRDWRPMVLNVIQYMIPYIAQIPSIVSHYPQKNENRFFPRTQKIMKEMRHVYYAPISVKALRPSPPTKWKHHELEKSTRTIIAQSIPLSLPGQEYNVDIIARLADIEDFGDDEYGIKINVQCRDMNNFVDRRTCRCTRLEIKCAFVQPPHIGAEPRVKAFRPDGGAFDKTEVKYTIKHAAKLHPSANSIKVAELSSEWGKETVRRQYGIVQGMESQQQPGVHWVFTENRSSNGGIPDCDLGAVIVSPSTQIKIEMTITAEYHIQQFSYFRPWGKTTRRTKTTAGTLFLNLPDSIKLSLLGLSKDQDAFLQGCTVKHLGDTLGK
ncbi:hypothetical protein BJ165DRAFT_1598071 [Panaeolus papilionaceus]|nr:hypothetical protein BJ165DRAFT_1598071 [Panaeolus papilionaceus]